MKMKTKKCPSCYGTGIEDNTHPYPFEDDCSRCNGRGYIEDDR